jgi:predicted DCC family thiol-disulfide oxidoreductase YuxK
MADAVPPGSDGPVMLFDGVCNLCNTSVQFALRRERDASFRYAPLQSEVGRRLATSNGIDPDAIDTVVVIEGGRAFTKSSAAIRVMRRLRGPWPFLARLLWLVPKPLRDLGYLVVAKLRYRIWGKRETCMVPTPEVRARFLA